jgi:putative ABC transport system substrate-binding protein
MFFQFGGHAGKVMSRVYFGTHKLIGAFGGLILGISKEEALQGFNASYPASQRLLVMSDYAEIDLVRIVREERPRLILAVGDSALSAARKIQQIPVISLMALGIHNRTSSSNLAGVGMYVSPERYMNLFQQMKVATVGVVYDPAKSGWYIREAHQAAHRMGIKLVLREISSSRQTFSSLYSMAGKIDALWMLPDTTAVSRETSEAYFRFSQEQVIPLVSFANAYLGLGAAVVLDLDRPELGRQAAGIAARILEGEKAESNPLYPRRNRLKTNPAILRNLGIIISSSSD